MKDDERIITEDNIWAFLTPICLVLAVFIISFSVRSCDSQDKSLTYEKEYQRQITIRTMVDEGWSADEIRCVTGRASELFCEYRARGEFDKGEEVETE